VFEDASQELLAEVKDVVMDTLLLMIPEAKGDWSLVSARVRSALKKFINKRMERRPMILPIIMEFDEISRQDNKSLARFHPQLQSLNAEDHSGLRSILEKNFTRPAPRLRTGNMKYPEWSAHHRHA
jgi:hypothetical protein